MSAAFGVVTTSCGGEGALGELVLPDLCFVNGPYNIRVVYNILYIPYLLIFYMFTFYEQSDLKVTVIIYILI